jgi:hypothetical protein
MEVNFDRSWETVSELEARLAKSLKKVVFQSSVPKGPRSTRPERNSFSGGKLGRTTAKAVNSSVCKVLPQQCLFLALDQVRD